MNPRNEIHLFADHIDRYDHNGNKTTYYIKPHNTIDKPIDIPLLHEMGYIVREHKPFIGIVPKADNKVTA